MKKSISIISAFVLALSVYSCKKNEGPGGAATITGVVGSYDVDGFGNQTDSIVAAKEDVYIIYGGENTMYDDDIETSYDGTFRFSYLEKGNYQLFVYSKCPPTEGCPDNKKPIIVDVSITEKKQVLALDTIWVQR